MRGSRRESPASPALDARILRAVRRGVGRVDISKARPNAVETSTRAPRKRTPRIRASDVADLIRLPSGYHELLQERKGRHPYRPGTCRLAKPEKCYLILQSGATL